ncbi:hypothetical protein JCM8208_002020 [Rhodotorula glutinis]
MAPKRALTASQSSQTTPSQPSSSAARPAKRPRVARSPPPAPSSSLAAPPTESIVPETPDPSLSIPAPASAPAVQPKPDKRPLVPGTLRRLTTGHPTRSAARIDPALAHPPLLPGAGTGTGKRPRPRVRPAATLAGAKVGGESKDLGDRVEREELWVRRGKGKGAQGLGFAGYLKMGVGAFVDRGCTSLTVNAMGAAIPFALSLALAIRDAIPGGAPPAPVPRDEDAPGDAHDDGEGIVRMSVRTGSKTVSDEVTPLDEDDDLVYQSRTKSTVSIELALVEPLQGALGAGTARVGRPGGAGSRRGGKRSGRGRGR